VLPQLRVLRAECGAIAHQCGLVYCFLDFGRAHPIVAAAPSPFIVALKGTTSRRSWAICDFRGFQVTAGPLRAGSAASAQLMYLRPHGHEASPYERRRGCDQGTHTSSLYR
jgi:hypothetical protein